MKFYLKDLYNRLNIKNKILAFNAIIICLVLALTLFFCFWFSIRKSSADIINISKALTGQQFKNSNYSISQLENLFLALSNGNILQDSLYESNQKRLDTAGYIKFTKELEHIRNINPYMTFVMVYNKLGVSYMTGDSGFADIKGVKSWAELNFKSIHSKIGKCSWKIIDGNIVIAREIFRNSTLESLGYIIIGIEKNYMEELCFFKSNGISSSYLLSKDGVCYVSPEENKVLSWEDFKDKIYPFKKGYIQKKFTLNGQAYLAQVSYHKDYNWAVVNLIPMKSLTSGWINSIAFSLIIVVIALVIAILFILYFSEDIAGRVTSLVRKMGDIAEGKFHTTVSFNRQDELGLLMTHLDELGFKIEELIQKAQTEEKIKKEMEIQVIQMRNYSIQSQMNPHFMYNAMETISSMAILEKAPEVSQAICSCANLFRLNTKRVNQFVTLQDEIDYIKCCMGFYELAYPYRIETEYHIDPSLTGYQIPCFLLHPLIENVIVHGVSKSNQAVKIIITARTRKDRLVIAVSDNSIGIEPEIVKCIKLSLKTGEESLSADNGNLHAKIGFKNINNIIRMNFGEKYGLKIKSQVGTGTLVVLTLPL